MACPSPFDALRIATEHLGNEIYRFPYTDTFFEKYITRGSFTKNTGALHSVFTGGNSEPIANVQAWSDVTTSASGVLTSQNSEIGAPANSVGLCDEPFIDVGVGFTETTYKPRRVSLGGPVICRDTLTFAHQPMEFFKQIYIPNLAHYVRRTLDLEFRNQLMALGMQASASSGVPEIAGGGTIGTQPTLAVAAGQLDQYTLDVIAARLIRLGATNAGERRIELGPDGPIFPLVLGLEASKSVSRINSDYRLDTNYAYEGMGPEAELMKRLGASKVVGNFRHKVVLDPPRATHDGTKFVMVNTWQMDAATGGTKAAYTSAYINAPYEAAIVVHPQQFIAEMVGPDNAGLAFDSASWMGDWRFVTGGSNVNDGYCFDPLHKYGRHFAELFYAPKPIYPTFGYTIWFKRCTTTGVGTPTYTACT